MAKKHLTMKDIQRMQEAYQSVADGAVFMAVSDAIIFLLLLIVFSIIKFKKWVLSD